MSEPATLSLEAAAAPLGLSLLPGQCAQLAAYADLLQHWNAAYNLTAIRDPAGIRQQHLLDCLAVLPNFERRLVDWRAGSSPSSLQAKPGSGQANGPLEILDVGSGGGLPGVVLAIARPDWSVRCIDTVGKKAAFVRQVAGELKLSNLEAIHGRVEQLVRPKKLGGGPSQSAGFDVVTSRAFASLVDMLRWTAPLVGPQGFWAALKGRLDQTQAEVAAALASSQGAVELLSVDEIVVPGLDAQRCVVWMKQAPTNG